MFSTLFFIFFGIYLGQEYHLPSVKLMFNKWVNILITPNMQVNTYTDTDTTNSDTDSDDTLVVEPEPKPKNYQCILS